MNFKSRVVVITGAASGIGRAITLQMAQEGAKLVIADVNTADLASVAAEAESAGAGQVLQQQLDVTDEQQWQTFAETVKNDIGMADVVFNNAGIARTGTFEEISPAEFDSVMAVNYWGMVYGTRAFLPQIKLRQGSFVNVSSLFGLIGVYGQAAYCSSKFAIRGFNESIRQEFAEFGVHVASVHPGGIKTNIVKNALDHEGNEQAEEISKQAQETALVMPPEKAADIIISGLRKRKNRIVVGNDAKLMSLLQRLFPVAYPAMMERLFSLTGNLSEEPRYTGAIQANLTAPSLRSKLVSWILRRNFKKKMSEGGGWEPQTLRAVLEKAVPKSIPKDMLKELIETQNQAGDSVKGEWHYNPSQQHDHTILYLHGGGYAFCSVGTHRAMTMAWAKQASAKVFSCDYRLAPEAPYPAALDDAFAAYQWLLEQDIPAEKIIIAGDSAGGGLSLALKLKIKQESLPQPAASVLLSPWTDLAATGASLDANEPTCAMFTGDMIRNGADLYAGDEDKTLPFISPLYGDLSELPPMRIYVSNTEVLADDSLRLFAKAEEAGVDVELRVWQGQPHVWPVMYGKLPEAKQTVIEMAQYGRSKI